MTRPALTALLLAALLMTPVALAQPDDGPRGPPEDRPGNGPEGGERDTNRTSKGEGNGNGQGGRPDGAGSQGEGAPGQGQGQGRPENPGQQGRDKAEERRAENLQRANERRAAAEARGVRDVVGSFDVQDGTVNGTHVSFAYSMLGVTNATAHGLTLFDVTTDADTLPRSGPVDADARGAQIRVTGPAYTMQVHDNPGAVFKFRDADTLEFAFPNGTILLEGTRRVDVLYETGETAHLVGGTFSVNGTTALADGKATFVLGMKRGAFDKHRADITNAMAENRVGAEVTVAKGDGNATAEDAVTFGNVTVQTQTAEGNVTLVVEGHGMDGRVIVANVQPEFFEAATAEDLVILFDGMPAERADSLLHVLNAPEGGENALYWIVEDADGYQIIFALPHYSVHTLSILDGIQEVPPSIVVGLVASVAVITLGGLVLFRRP